LGSRGCRYVGGCRQGGGDTQTVEVLLGRPRGRGSVWESTTNLALFGGVEKRGIIIADYEPAWPQQYERPARLIRDVLGSRLMRIEHIGSTAVPGLAAKPIIDILAVVPNSADESSYVPQLGAVGYSLRVREPGFFEHRMLRT